MSEGQKPFRIRSLDGGGFLGGWLAYAHPPGGTQRDEWLLWAATLAGAVFCAFVCALIAMERPNRRYEAAVLSGWLLLIVDVPKKQVGQVVELIRSHHEEADIRIVSAQEPVLAGRGLGRPSTG